MQVGTATSILNPTSEYFNSQGTWVTYILLIVVVHFILLCVPFFSTAVIWTLTCTIHNVVMYRLLHWEKGSPYETLDQGEARVLTQWEQFDDGEQFSPTKKFLLVVPIVLDLETRARWLSFVSAFCKVIVLIYLFPFYFCLIALDFPFAIFLLASFYTEYDTLHCLINSSSLIILAVLPKLPQFYRVRLFGINRW